MARCWVLRLRYCPNGSYIIYNDVAREMAAPKSEAATTFSGLLVPVSKIRDRPTELHRKQHRFAAIYRSMDVDFCYR